MRSRGLKIFTSANEKSGFGKFWSGRVGAVSELGVCFWEPRRVGWSVLLDGGCRASNLSLGIKDHRSWDLPGDGYGDFPGGLMDGGGEPLEDFSKF